MATKAIDLFNEIDDNELNREDKLTSISKMKIHIAEQRLVIYLCLINALSQIAMLKICQSTVQRIPTSIRFDTRIQNALIDMWVCSEEFDSYKSTSIINLGKSGLYW